MINTPNIKYTISRRVKIPFLISVFIILAYFLLSGNVHFHDFSYCLGHSTSQFSMKHTETGTNKPETDNYIISRSNVKLPLLIYGTLSIFFLRFFVHPY
jgi:hypothetical protein